MTNQHPITPSPELVGQWLTEAADLQLLTPSNLSHLATQAARWGADQELEACCNYFEDHLRDGIARDLRTARRPKPPSLKEQAITALHAIAAGANDTREQHQDLETIRKALEQLNDE
jgi:hypothetical protein